MGMLQAYQFLPAIFCAAVFYSGVGKKRIIRRDPDSPDFCVKLLGYVRAILVGYCGFPTSQKFPVMRHLFWLLFFGFGICIPCSKAQNADVAGTLPGSKLQAVGRFALTAGHQMELISSAAHVAYSFEGDQTLVYFSLPKGADHAWIQYEMDGLYKERIRISELDSRPVVFKASGASIHQVRIFKATEAITGPVFIDSIKGKNITPIGPLPAGKGLIEFIGNSITCGAQSDPSLVPCNSGWYEDHHNAYMAYGPRVARALGAEYMLSSVSGIGIYRNWNSNGPAMPRVYKKTDFEDSSAAIWDFSRFQPGIVSIALGTNDFSGGDGTKTRLPFDSVAFVTNYIQFVLQVKRVYPEAKIALLSSPILQGEQKILLEHCLTRVKEQIDGQFPSDHRVALFFFEPFVLHGCTGHPGVDDHRVMAEALIPFFRPLL